MSPFTEWFLDFDPMEIITLLVLGAVVWTQLRSTVKWHTEWINQHDDRENKQDQTLATAIETQSMLVALTKQHEKRLDRVERFQDRA